MLAFSWQSLRLPRDQNRVARETACERAQAARSLELPSAGLRHSLTSAKCGDRQKGWRFAVAGTRTIDGNTDLLHDLLRRPCAAYAAVC